MVNEIKLIKIVLRFLPEGFLFAPIDVYSVNQIQIRVEYLKIMTDQKKSVLQVIEASELSETEFCLITLTDEKNIHYLSTDKINSIIIKDVLKEQSIGAIYIDEKDLIKLLSFSKGSNYLLVGNPKLMPFSF